MPNVCQLCLKETGTVEHRFNCEVTKPCGGWPAVPLAANLARRKLSAERLQTLKHRGVLAVRVHAPVRHTDGWFNWDRPLYGDIDDDTLRWYIDGSAMHAR